MFADGSTQVLAESRIVRRRPVDMIKYGSGRTICRVRGFQLADVPAGGGIIYVKFSLVSFISLQWIINFVYLKLFSKYLAFPSSI